MSAIRTALKRTGTPPFRYAIAVSVLLSAILAACPEANAIAPCFVSDAELVEKPVIVVARWDKSPQVPRRKIEGNVCVATETHTEIIIERVIKGKVKPGKHAIILGFALFLGCPHEIEVEDGAEEDDFYPVWSCTSTEVFGEAENVTESNIWFLERMRSWDDTDEKEYLALTTYRGVQPMVLESYYAALRSPNPRESVPKLLSETGDPVMLARVLEYVAGGNMPWPFRPWEVLRYPFEPHKPIISAAPGVKGVLKHDAPDIRASAAAVYGHLVDEKSLSEMRELLKDTDIRVRCVAVGELARFKDCESAELLFNALRERKGDYPVTAVAARLAGWGAPEAVPALIALLESEDEYSDGPVARSVLKEITGFRFPLKVELSINAWNEARQIADQGKRLEYLRAVLPYESELLTAKLEKEDDEYFILVTNVSDEQITVAYKCKGITTDAVSGWRGIPCTKPESADSFLTLGAGESFRLEYWFWDEDSDVAPGEDIVRIAVTFEHNGTEFGLKAWTGVIDVDLRTIRPAKVKAND